MKFTKNTLKRALRTFIQAALSYFAVNIVLVDFSSERDVIKTALAGLIISSTAAGLAAIMNLEDKEDVDNGEEDYE